MALPSGPGVTFLFTDVEGSTRHERGLGTATWARVVGELEARLGAAVDAAGGRVVKTEGDAIFAAFDRPLAALDAIVAAQRAVARGGFEGDPAIAIRAGLHLGEGRLRPKRDDADPDDYVGIDINYAARLAAAGNGGQVLLSDALVAAAGPAIEPWATQTGVRLIDEGPRGLKDFEEPQRVVRLVVPGAADDGRPLRTLQVPGNLPVLPTGLVGRDAELDRLAAALDQGRILTITGPGGSGKTRLAVAFAEGARDRFPHGAWFVDLQSLQDPARIEAAVAGVVGVREGPDRTVEAVLRDWLRDRRLLLLLDNLEQLLPGAAGVVAGLVRAATGLTVLITTRELLRVAGERALRLEPLDAAAGRRLFVERALAHRPDLPIGPETSRAIDAICERLGGLPLAIELAAARVRLLAPAAILERLGRSLELAGGTRDALARQRSLRGTIEWSYDLLDPAEQAVLRTLGVFAGGCTIDDLGAVLQPAVDPFELQGLVESLSDKSLVQVEPGDESPGGEPRFSLHPLIREYARDRLAERGELESAVRRHAAVYADVAEAAGDQIFGPNGSRVMARLDRDHANLQVAIDAALAARDCATAARLASGTWRWYQQRGRLREGRAALATVLDGDQPLEPALRLRALSADGGLAYWMEDLAGARRRYEEQLRLAEEHGDPRALAEAHYDIGFLSMVDGAPEPLRVHEQRAYDLFEAIGDEAGMTRARQGLVLHDFLVGDLAAAREKQVRTVDFFRAEASPF